MSKQIAIRLPQDLVDYMDGLVAGGQAKSRAAVVARALSLEQRRAGAIEDALIYASQPRSEEFDAMHEYLRGQPLDLD